MDINQGNRFVFLKKDATAKMRMRASKQRVTYIFEGEAANEGPKLIIEPPSKGFDMRLIKEESLSGSGATPESYSDPNKLSQGKSL
jgi:hypothetical protein